MSLNVAQRTAVETLKGPLLVLAGAGTGKTRVVTYRIANLIRHGIQPSRILAVTFTNKAAKEMQQRIGALLKQTAAAKSKPEVSTFHSLCVRILRRHITKLGYPQKFAIYDRGDQESVARQVLKEIKVQDAALKPAELLAKISTWKSAGITADNIHQSIWSAKDHLASLAYGRYQNALKTVGAVDFDDLLLVTEELFGKFPDVLKSESARFDHLLVDEYQDTNMSQYRIVKGLALPHRNICVVGDDDQAIYAWRGADVKHILSFQKDWTDAKIVRLEENYRSTQPIIHWANTLIAFNKQRHGKKLVSPNDGDRPVILQCKDGETEARTVVARIKERIEKATVQPRDIAVLFRTNDQPRVFEMELRNAKIPYILIGGQSFFDRKEVRDVLAYLKVVNRPQDDISLLRVINTPPRGIGQTAVQRLTEVSVTEKKPIWENLKPKEYAAALHDTSDDSSFALQTSLSPSVVSFRQLIEEQQRILQRDFSVENLKNFIAEIQYEKEINRHYAEESERSERWNSVGEVLNAAAEYIKESQEKSRKAALWEFLDNTSLAGPDFTSGKPETAKGANAVTLMTLHAAKGLEFSEVYMVGLEEGILPHHRSVKASEEDESAVDEERRLCYVGITRAKRLLTVSLALNRLKWGKMRPTVPSRFLYEITGQTASPNYWRAIAGEPPQKNNAVR
ncbi:MAG: UvrD-helicase domain-containing protein [Planctomycetaceae bacterium]|jgi:DNA helicase-2/ATP-dependent DNA helicase PcrA|nr:UvrD-helicase domain-containing protein [Planctomycetaceae bacterium]